jgi:hypothetical protein
MDRAALERRLAGSAVRAELLPVTLSNGDRIALRKLTNDEMLRVATASGSDDDSEARFFIGALRFSVVDDDASPLLRSYEEAAAFVNSLDLDDFAALRDAVEASQPSLADDEAVEAGKAY